MSTSRQDPLPKELPLLPLRSTALYPLGVVALQIGTPSTLEMLAANGVPNLPVALVIAPGAPEDPLDRKQLAKIGLLARVTDRLNLPGGTQQVTVQGLRRIRIDEVSEHDGYFLAQISAARERPASDARAQELIAHVLTDLEALSQTIDRIPREVPRILRMNIADPSRFTDLVASLANFSVQQKDDVLQILSVEARLRYVVRELAFQLQRARQVEETAERGAADEGEPAKLTAAEHSAQLRRRIRLMQAELGEVDPVEREVVELLARIEAEELPARVAARARVEAERLRMVPPAAPEAGDIRAYVDWLLNLPWHARATDGPGSIDLGTVSETLDARLLGLDEQKSRLLDYLAVAKLRGDLHGPVPCLVGPPEVGKTALAGALAAGLGRPLAKIELRGRD
ncbi:MAG: LON peptidase substrate-binding domain-containing protein, partial [Longimicrobiales bacterium]